jgi:glycosyltransferase involved in cell wall biosynthesis
VGVEHIELEHHSKNPFTALKALAELNAVASRFKPDIIHTHMMPGTVLSYLVSRMRGIPLVSTMHNSFDVTSNLMRLADRVVAVSTTEMELLKKRGYRETKLEVVINGPNGSARESFDERASRSGYQSPVETGDHLLLGIKGPAIASIAGLHKRKGLDFLIRAFASVSGQYPEWQLYIAGWGPDYDKLMELKAQLGVGERVHLLKFISAPKRLLARSDIFVLPSLAEPFGLVVSEARTAGCAVIGTSVGGIPEQLEYGNAGLLVEPANVEQLASALQSLMSDPDELSRARLRAKKNADFFQISRVVADYDKVYRRLLNDTDPLISSAREPLRKSPVV